jgi:hypothetical protein
MINVAEISSFCVKLMQNDLKQAYSSFILLQLNKLKHLHVKQVEYLSVLMLDIFACVTGNL